LPLTQSGNTININFLIHPKPMKYPKIPQSVCLTGLLLLVGATGAQAANVTKADTATMSAASDWSAAPTSATIGEFNATPSAIHLAALTVNGTTSLAGLLFDSTILGPVNITASSTLNIYGSGINASASPFNVTISAVNCSATGSQTFSINSGQTLSIPSITLDNSGDTLTLTDNGIMTLGSLNTGNGSGGVLISGSGTLTVSDINIQRAGTTFGTAPTATTPIAFPTTTGLYVNGTTVNLTTVEFGTGNAGGYGLIAAGTVGVTGKVTVGQAQGSTRWCGLEVSGGTFTSSDTVNGVVIAPNYNNVTADIGEFYVAGGTATAARVAFGQSADTVGGTGWLILKGTGSLYVGAGGIVKAGASAYSANVALYSGTLGASNSWSSSLPMQLSGPATAPFVIQAANASATPYNITLSGVLSGVGSLQKTGGGTLTLSGANTFAGTNFLNAGILNVNAAETPGTSGPLGKNTAAGAIVFGGGTLQYSSANHADYSGRFTNISQTISLDLNNQPVTFASVIQGSAVNVTLADSSVAGGGILSLTAVNTYGGNTTLSSGTLNVNGSGSIAGNGVTVNGGVLGGTGSVGSSVIVNTGGIAPGVAGAGTLNLTSSLNLGATATNNFGFTSSSVNAQANVTGTLTVDTSGDGGTLFNLVQAGTSLPWTTPGTYNLIEFGSLANALDATWTTASGTNPHILNPQPHLTYQFGVSGSYLTLTIVSLVDVDVWALGDFADDWSNPAAWTATTGSTPPHNAGDTATFASDSAQYSVTLDQAETVGDITMNNPNSTVIIAAGNTLTLDNGGAASVVTVGAGSANAINPPVTLNNNVTVTVGGGDQLSLAGGLANGTANGVLTLNGAGTTVLPLANSYGPSSATAVGTTLSGGVLQVGNSSSLSTGELNVTSSGTLQAGAAGLSVGNNLVVNPGATVTVNNGGNPLTLGGVISGAGSLNSIGTGTLVLGAANTYAGGTTISGGTMFNTAVVSISADGATTGSAGSLGAVPTVATPDNIILNGGDLLGTANLTLHANRGVGIGSTSPANVGSFTGLIDAAAGTTLTVNGIIASAGNLGQQNLTVNGGAGNSGTVVLGNANTFNGLTTIYNGTLTLGNANALQASTLDYLGLGGTLSFGTLTSATFGNLEGTQNLSLMNAASTPAAVSLTVGNASSTTYSGILSGTGASLTKQGSGTLTLTGVNTYSGSTTDNGGELELSTGGAITTTFLAGQGFLVDGGTLVVSGATSLNDAIDFTESSGSVTFQSSIAYNSAGDGGAYDITGGTFSAAAVNLSRSASYGTAPTATAPVSANTQTGFYVNGSTANVTLGTITIGTSGAASSTSMRVDAGNVTVTGEVLVGYTGATRWCPLQINGGTFTSSDTANGIVLAPNQSTNPNYAELYLSGGTTTANRIAIGASGDTAAGAGWVFVNGGATLYLGGGGLVAPGTKDAVNIELTSGILGATANWSSSLNMNMPGTTFTIQTADASSAPHNITLTGILSGAGALNVTGGGILTLGGVDTYTGTTTVNGGTLAVTGSLAAGSAVTVNSGATLTGSGTINGTLTLASGALLNLTAGSTLTSGALTLNGNTLTVSGTVASSGTITLMTYPSETGSLGTINLSGLTLPANNTATITLGATALTLSVQPNVTFNNWIAAGPDSFWDDTANWDTGISPNGAGTGAALGNVLGPVTLDVPVTVGYVDFNNAGSYTISGGNTLTLDNNANGALVNVTGGNANAIDTAVSLNDNTTIAVGTGDSLTLAGTIANASAVKTLTLNGPGTSVLNAANTYGPATAGTTGTTLGGAVVQVGNSGALGAGDVAVTGGSTLQAGTTGLSVANNLALSAGATFTANNNGETFTLAGILSGSGNLISLGAGTTVLSGNNTATGNTTLTNGTLQLANANAVKGRLNLASGTTLQLRGDVNTTFAPAGLTIQTNLAGNATDVFNLDAGPVTPGVTGNTLTLNGTFNNGTNDNTTINVTGNSTYTLALGNFVSGNTGHNPEYLTAFNTAPGGASLSIAQILTGNWSQWLNFQGGGNVTLTGSLTNVSQGSAIVYVTGGTTLTLQGRSSLWASATGVTDGYRYDVANGTLVLGNSYALTNNTTGAAGVPSYFILGAATNLYYVTGANGPTPPAGVLVNVNNSYNAAVYLASGSLSTGAGGLSVGATVTNWVSDGDLTFANSGVMTIGGLNVQGVNTYYNPIILGWNANKGKSVTLAEATGGELDFAGPIWANGSDTTAGVTVGNATFGGTVKLLAANTYAGPTVINNGVLELGPAASLMPSSSVTIAPGAAFDVSSQSVYTLGSSSSLTASGDAVGPAIIKGAFGGTVNLGSRPITLNYDGSDPALSIYQGTLTLGGNVLTVNGATLGSGSYPLIWANVGAGITGTATVTGTAIPTSGYTVSLVVGSAGVGLQITENTSTALALTTGTSPSTYGSALTYTATVSSLAGTPTTPGGNVVFQDGATVLATVPLTAGTASYTSYTALGAGPHSIAAYYQGDATHGLSDSSASPVAQSVTPKALTVTGLSVPASKVYDGTVATAAPLGTPALLSAETPGTGTATDGTPYSGDTVSVNGIPAGSYNDPTVAGATTVTITGLTSGNANYTINAPTQLAGITVKALTVSGLSVPASKVYDGTTATATPTGTATLATAEAPAFGTGNDGAPYTVDNVTLSGSATGAYNSATVAGANTVTFGGYSQANGNYTLTPLTQAATITAKALTVTGLSVPASKVYDGTTATATPTGTATLATAEAPAFGTGNDGAPYTGDSVSLTGSATGTYDSATVAGATTVTFGGYSQANANYTLSPLTQAATITAKALTVTGLSVPATKVYDGTTATATPTGTATLATAEAPAFGTGADGAPYTGDSITIGGSATGAYNSATVANAATVTISGLNPGNGNYTLTPLTQAATITAKPLTIQGLSVAASKPYDGTTSATVIGTAALLTPEAGAFGTAADDAPYSTDSVSVTGTPVATYNSATVAAANLVTFTGLSLAGTDDGNYSLVPLTQAATITPAASTLVLTSSALTNANLSTLTFTATVQTNGVTAGDATGSVQFVTNTVDYGVAVGLTAATVNTNLSTLPRGTNYVYAIYSGDANYATSTSTTLTEVITNNPPVAATLTVTQYVGLTLQVALSSLPAQWSDIDGDTITLTNINLTTTNGVALTLQNVTTNVDGSFALNPNSYIVDVNTGNTQADQISYTITDSQGGVTTGYINVVVQPVPVFEPGLVSYSLINNTATVNFTGNPAYVYDVQRAVSLTGNWVTIDTAQSPNAGGTFQITDTFSDLGGIAPPQAFYRLVWNP
jgi:autotransporter-associated beta strand protein